MDNLTHTLSGVVVSRTGLGRTTPGATLALALGANLPDVDVVSGLFGAATYLHHHRGWTHSVLGAPLLALLLAGVLRLTIRDSKLPALALCATIGAALHVVMDLWTTYGTRVLAPFDNTWYSLDLVFIIDPILLALLLAPLFVRRHHPLSRQVATVAVGLVVAYVGGRAVLHAQAVDEVAARTPAGPVLRAAAFPTVHPLRWSVLSESPAAYFTGEVHLGRSAAALERRAKPEEDAVVAQVRASSEVAAVFLDFSRFPLLEIRRTAEGTAVSWRDLRFERLGRTSFVTQVLVGPDGGIRSETFRF